MTYRPYKQKHECRFIADEVNGIMIEPAVTRLCWEPWRRRPGWPGCRRSRGCRTAGGSGSRSRPGPCARSGGCPGRVSRTWRRRSAQRASACLESQKPMKRCAGQSQKWLKQLDQLGGGSAIPQAYISWVLCPFCLCQSIVVIRRQPSCLTDLSTLATCHLNCSCLLPNKGYHLLFVNRHSKRSSLPSFKA